MTATGRPAYHFGQMRELNPGGSGFRVPAQAQEMIDALRKLFDASVVLYDGQRHKHHVARDSRGWFSLEVTAKDGSPVCHVEAQINERWTLSVWSRRRLHRDADAMVQWAAGKLAPYFPGKRADEPTALGFSSGVGPSGAGAPVEVQARTLVWSRRKTRN